MKVDGNIQPADLLEEANRVFELGIEKVKSIDKSWKPENGTPVFTVEGKYTTRGWTEWTQGFQYGNALLCFDATGDRDMLELGRRRTINHMLPHVTHMGVHDHGFNNLSTYGNLARLMTEGKYQQDKWEYETYTQAIRTSGAVQAMRWAPVKDLEEGVPGGFIYSFNGPHSLFIDTMRSLRILGVAHQLGHVLMGEGDQRINLLHRLIVHALTTDRWIIFHGDSEHTYDVRGRTAHEGIFNRNDGAFRCRSTQQGYAPFSTWTRGLSWAMLGYAEQLEFFETLSEDEVKEAIGLTKAEVVKRFTASAVATCDHYIEDVTAEDGITYWDDGAPNLHKLGEWQHAPADPYNGHEPVDSTASAIAAQGLIRLGHSLGKTKGRKYLQAGLTTAEALFNEPYISTNKSHQGLLLHSIYHRPNNWDHIPAGSKIPHSESSMWGDYHLLELANLVKRVGEEDKYPTFFGI